MEGTEVAFPTITFSDRMQLNLGGVVIELIYVAPSRTKGGVLVNLPAEKVVPPGISCSQTVIPIWWMGMSRDGKRAAHGE